ncbi:WD40/YVTN/BNR-like repeat-containing protein [Paenibacillus lemnae]|uniref:Photosynthesis system II assembly factor Ycf48/Hcf136-like domain-containing protein n=1 Tax=Paenibacillus lemnae TaxID=1330551 RepID=A0A848M0L5_PAELE|nr:hypothetical protein [Paenibacillus lemnae]NMO94305.1 hypothetical protein [Paenibacillus lemnae]
MKKTVILFICFTLLWPLLGSGREVSAAPKGSVDQITLKESPYSLGEGWTLDASYSSSPPYSLAIGKREYLAVGPYGTVMKSKDGRSWKALSKFGNYQLTTIAWNGSKYVIFGSNTEYAREAAYAPSEGFVSADGLKWTKIAFEPGEAIHYAAAGKGGFVAVGREHVFTSGDGVKWTKTLTLGSTYGSNSIKYVNGTYFIFGYEEKKIYISRDGRKWTSKPMNTGAGINDLVWTGKQYLGVGNGIYTSKDGVTWKKQSKSPAGVQFQSIFTNGKTYIAVGSASGSLSSGQVSYTSSNGASWAKHDISHVASVYTMYPVSGGFAGIGSNKVDGISSDGTYALFTSDGKKWSYRLAGTSGSGDFRGIATNGKRTVAVGLDGSVVYTVNGSQWKSSHPFSFSERLGRAHLFDVAWGAGKFVAVGNGGVYVSADGVSWKSVRVPFKDQYGGLRQILWTGKFFVASDQVYGVYTSKDGLKWTKVSSVSKSDYWLTSMVWDGKRVVAAFQMYNNGKQYTKIMQSTNGTTWAELARLQLTVADMAWNGKGYVAADLTSPTRMWVSKDAKRWTKAGSGSGLDQQDSFQFITSFNGQFFAFNDSLKEAGGDYVTYHAYYVSKDGLKWKEIPVPDKNSDVDTRGNEMMYDGVKAHGKYIFVGAHGHIMYTKTLKL